METNLPRRCPDSWEINEGFRCLSARDRLEVACDDQDSVSGVAWPSVFDEVVESYVEEIPTD